MGLTLLTFVIPIRHHENSKDWRLLVEHLRTTVDAIESQEGDQWQAVIVANEKSILPSFSPRVRIHRVDFPPNPYHELGSTDLETFRDAVRLDKGRRILAGMRAAGQTDYFMVVDDDDFISNSLARFVEQRNGRPGWFFQQGYVWSAGSALLYLYEPFYLYCGTSHILRADLVNLDVGDDEAGIIYTKKALGSHVSIANMLAQSGTPLEPLPFPGAVYRIGHSESHSKSPSLLPKFLLNREILLDPRQAIQNIKRFKWRNAAINREFFAGAQS